MRAFEKILIVGPSWIGDMVMAQSLFISLRQNYPQCSITVLAPAWSLPLLDRMPEVAHSSVLDIGHNELKLVKRRSIGKKLKRENFDTAIILPNSFKSALIPFHAGIGRRIGWRGELRDILLTDCRKLNKQQFPLMVQRFASLAQPRSLQPPKHIPQPELLTSAEDSREAVRQLGLRTEGRILGICPGAEFGDAKKWPARHYAELASQMIAEGWQVWLFGSDNDCATAASIVTAISPEHQKGCYNLTGKTSLAQAIDLMALTSAVVSNDSGLMHIAAALDKPVVAIYGSTSADFTPPLSRRAKLLSTEIECRPCFQRSCPLGHLRCLTEISPQLVHNALTDLIAAE